jgi:hypothetical protein
MTHVIGAPIVLVGPSTSARYTVSVLRHVGLRVRAVDGAENVCLSCEESSSNALIMSEHFLAARDADDEPGTGHFNEGCGAQGDQTFEEKHVPEERGLQPYRLELWLVHRRIISNSEPTYSLYMYSINQGSKSSGPTASPVSSHTVFARSLGWPRPCQCNQSLRPAQNERPRAIMQAHISN